MGHDDARRPGVRDAERGQRHERGEHGQPYRRAERALASAEPERAEHPGGSDAGLEHGRVRNAVPKQGEPAEREERATGHDGEADHEPRRARSDQQVPHVAREVRHAENERAHHERRRRHRGGHDEQECNLHAGEQRHADVPRADGPSRHPVARDERQESAARDVERHGCRVGHS